MSEKEERAFACEVFVDLVIDSTVHIVTLDALVDALEEAKRVGIRLTVLSGASPWGRQWLTRSIVPGYKEGKQSGPRVVDEGTFPQN
jgi:hypothetical protein